MRADLGELFPLGFREVTRDGGMHMEYFMEMEITPDEEALFTPIGTDASYRGDLIAEVESGFESLSGKKSWTYGPLSATAPYLDRFFTFEFDDDHVFDICWTYADETDTDPESCPHWFFTGGNTAATSRSSSVPANATREQPSSSATPSHRSRGHMRIEWVMTSTT